MIEFVKRMANAAKDVLYYGYNGTQDKGRRSAPAYRTQSEDEQLDAFHRKRAIATQRDQTRNLPWVAWMVRKHMDYVSNFSFRGTSDDDALNEKLEDLMEEWSRPENCDVAGRHSLSEMINIFEANKVTDGDCAFLKVQGKLQGIEADKICKPESGKAPKGLTDHGLLLRKDNSVKAYAICDRGIGGMMTLKKMAPAKNVEFGGYFKRFDQTRGISPLLSALNTNQDLAENFEYTLIKIKFHAMLGAQITRESTSTSDGWDYSSNTYNKADGNEATEYHFDMTQPGLKLEMDPGDKVELLESKTPSEEFQDFTEAMMRIALLALDMPFTMLNSKQSNNNAMRTEFRQYMDSAQKKQEANRRILDNLTRWKTRQWLVEGRLTLAEFRAIKWLWQPAGMFLFDPESEIRADTMAVAGAFGSRTSITRSRGGSFRQVAKDLKREQDLLKDLGVTTTIGQPGQMVLTGEEPEPVQSPPASQPPEPVQQEAPAFVEGAYYRENGNLYQYKNGELVSL
jgi:capsid protein